MNPISGINNFITNENTQESLLNVQKHNTSEYTNINECLPNSLELKKIDQNTENNSFNHKSQEKLKNIIKKSVKKFKIKLKKKKTIDDIYSIISTLVAYTQINGKDYTTVIATKLSNYLTDQLALFNISMPQKYKEILLNFIITLTDNNLVLETSAAHLLGLIFKINLLEDLPEKYSSGLSPEKVEKMLENRINYIGWRYN